MKPICFQSWRSVHFQRKIFHFLIKCPIISCLHPNLRVKLHEMLQEDQRLLIKIYCSQKTLTVPLLPKYFFLWGFHFGKGNNVLCTYVQKLLLSLIVKIIKIVIIPRWCLSQKEWRRVAKM